MQPQYQTPGVYIVEKDAFPNTIVEVATAIPAFIGYTQQATFNGKDLTKIPTKVGSLKEFEEMFGVGYLQTFELNPSGGSATISGELKGGTVKAGSITAAVGSTPTTITNATITNPNIVNTGHDITDATIVGANISSAVVNGTITKGTVVKGTDTGDISQGSGNNITAGTITAGTITIATIAGSSSPTITITDATITGATLAKSVAAAGGTAAVNVVLDGGTATKADVTGATITGAVVTMSAFAPDFNNATVTQGQMNGTAVAGVISDAVSNTAPVLTEGTMVVTTKSTGSPSTTTTTSFITGATLTGATVTVASGTITGATITKPVLGIGSISSGGITGGTLTIDSAGTIDVNTGIDINGAVINSPITGGTLTSGILSLPGPSNSPNVSALTSVALSFPQINPAPPQQATLLLSGKSLFYLYNSIRLFYQNGGATCYIVSLRSYASVASASHTNPGYQEFEDAIDLLETEQDPTMLLCPDALMLDAGSYYDVANHMLEHCYKVKSRVAIFDVYGNGTAGIAGTSPTLADIDSFRNGITSMYPNYGIAYFPWVNAAIVAATDVTFLYLTPDALTTLISLMPNTPLGTSMAAQLAAAKGLLTPSTDPKQQAAQQANRRTVHNALFAGSPEYALTMKAIATQLNVLPVTPAMAGVYTAVDTARGVWKAPANVGLNAVVSPTVSISHDQQENLNVDALTGKSINAIRTFKGLGTMVWGARTLDGNSQDWRYINVRRTLIMIEESIKLSMRKYVFEPNDANTWTTVKSMINSFLFTLWKQGALPGATPADAYQVSIGLGTTMTGDDILNGIMNVSVLVVLDRPAEFIVLTFQQEMQKS